MMHVKDAVDRTEPSHWVSRNMRGQGGTYSIGGNRPIRHACGIETAEGEIEKAAGEVNKSRGYAFLKDPELKAYSLEIAGRLGDYGY